MKLVFFSPAAASDLREIFDYVAQSNANAATQLLAEIEAACESLGRHPRLGVPRDDLIPRVRLFVVRQTYAVFYRIREDEVEIVRIAHGRRDFFKLFDS